MYYYVIHNEAKYFIGFRTLMISCTFNDTQNFSKFENF